VFTWKGVWVRRVRCPLVERYTFGAVLKFDRRDPMKRACILAAWMVAALACTGCSSSYFALREQAALRLRCAESELNTRQLDKASDSGAETACVTGCGIGARYMLSCISMTGLGGCNWVQIEQWQLAQGAEPREDCFPRASRKK
jgi:hypothetical protein